MSKCRARFGAACLPRRSGRPIKCPNARRVMSRFDRRMADVKHAGISDRPVCAIHCATTEIVGSNAATGDKPLVPSSSSCSCLFLERRKSHHYDSCEGASARRASRNSESYPARTRAAWCSRYTRGTGSLADNAPPAFPPDILNPPNGCRPTTRRYERLINVARHQLRFHPFDVRRAA